MNGETIENKVVDLRIEDIIPNRFQPREIFDETGLSELSDSIKEHGVIQPIIVRKIGNKYELIAGERRMKASSLAGLTTIPAIVREMDDRESAKVSLLENLQRKNLSAIEEAKTYKRILELENMTQEDLARTMGRSQPMVANKLRLLSLPEEVQEALMKNKISERHARSLLTITDKKDQLMFLERIQKERLTVRELDAEIKKYKQHKEERVESFEEKEEKNKEGMMNNNRSNFGGMGLNDYQSGINSNMFNNIPNNFNNMANTSRPNEDRINSNFNYGSFGDNNISSDNSSNLINNNGVNLRENDSIQPKTAVSSLGSMFDGDMGKVSNNLNDLSGESNLFISQIREDNVPKKENQFLPNFDDIELNSNSFSINNNSNYESMPQENSNSFLSNSSSESFSPQSNQTLMSQNSYPTNFNMNAGQEINNYNSPMNSMTYNDSFQPIESNRTPENNYYNFKTQMEPFNSYNGNSNENTMLKENLNLTTPENLKTGMNMYGIPENGIEQETHSSQGTKFIAPPINNDYSMDSFEKYNEFNKQSDSPIPDYGLENTTNSNPNSGSMFNQPLNIVEPYGTEGFARLNSFSESPIQPATIRETDTSISSDNPLDSTSENILFHQPVSIATEENYEESEQEALPKETESLQIPDIEIIGDTDTPLPNVDKENNYIHLGEERTIHSTHDAVLELKKTTDRIKQNHIDIETEEIDFDDVYQITIKIKKEEN